MFLRATAAGLLAATLITSSSQAQIQQPQVVQLPTFSFFTVSTTVSVPVSGRGFLGGVQRRRSASMSRGLPWVSSLPAAGRLARSRALASEASASSATATATIIDLKELDEAVLAEAAARRGAASRVISDTDRKALRLSLHVGQNTATAGELRLGTSPQSVAEIRRQNAAAEPRREAQLMAYWKKARAAESAGRKGAARCSYEVVARLGTGKLRAAARARLEALNRQSHVAQPQ